MWRSAILTGLLLLAGAARADVPAPEHSADIGTLDAVIICSPAKTHREPAPGTEAGYIQVPDEAIAITRKGQLVPDALGMAFGVAAISLRDVAPVTMRVYRPGRDQPETYLADFSAGVESTEFFSFDEESERVPGIWTFEAWDGATRLYRVSFEVVPQDAAPGIVADCQAATS
jgi:hypothetical protein